MKPKRQDTTLESEGAEFLVLGHLLIIGINAYKAYVNYPGYDLIATSTDNYKVCKIQVKSRWATNYNKGFPIKSLDSDFVAHVALNRGYSAAKKRKIVDDDLGVRPPQFYIFPTDVIQEHRREGKWNVIRITDIPDYQKYENNWELIKEFLNKYT